jgi:hypothetical protein
MHLQHRHPVLAPPLVLALLAGAPGTAAPGVPAEAAPFNATISAVAIEPDPVHPGSKVVVTVQTSPDVVAVDAHVKSFTFHLDPVQSGEFQCTGTVPKIARFFKGTYRVTFVARRSGGQTTEYGQDVVLN